MKILIIGNLNTVFTFEYIKEVLMSSSFTNIVVLTSETEDNTKINVKEYCLANNISIIYSRERKKVKKNVPIHPFIILSNILRFRIVKDFDVVHFHGISPITFFASFFIKKKTSLILSYYGSDLLRSTRLQLKLQKRVLKRAKYITLATYDMIDKFNQVYNNKYKEKIIKAMYGTTQVDYFNNLKKSINVIESKNKYGLPLDKISVFIGYNGYRSQNHLKIISILSKLNDTIKNRIHLVCHCAYGLDVDYKNEILQSLIHSRITYSFLTNYLNKEELVYLRYSSEIFINLQQSDALSATMIESMEAGAIVIKGDWLKYKEIEDYNGFYINIFQIKDLLEIIPKLINNINDYKIKLINNKGILCYLLSWKSNSKIWLSLYK